MTSTEKIDTTLRSLDAATPSLDADDRARLDAAIDRIVAEEPRPARTGLAVRRFRAPGRALALTGVAAVAAVSALALRGGSDEAAYATWAPEPAVVAAGDLDAVVAACRDKIGFDRSSPVPFDARVAILALAERRGDYVAVLLRDPRRDLSADCIARNTPGSDRVSDLSYGVAGSDGPPATVGPNAFLEGSIGEYHTSEGIASFTDGAVGAGVVGVTIHAGEHSVVATVDGGRFVAWWPGRAFPDEPALPSGEGGPEPILTYDLTLADGTVLRDVKPSTPTFS